MPMKACLFYACVVHAGSLTNAFAVGHHAPTPFLEHRAHDAKIRSISQKSRSSVDDAHAISRDEFPALAKLEDSDLIYFDNAATTQKPRIVLEVSITNNDDVIYV